jgi:hypothetical protein
MIPHFVRESRMQDGDAKPTATKMPPWGWGTEAEVHRLAARLNRLLAESRMLREMEALGVPAIDRRQKPRS